MVKGMYKQLCLTCQIGGIRTKSIFKTLYTIRRNEKGVIK